MGKVRLFGCTTDDEEITHDFDTHSQAIDWLAVNQDKDWQFVYINPVPVQAEEVPC